MSTSSGLYCKFFMFQSSQTAKPEDIRPLVNDESMNRMVTSTTEAEFDRSVR